MKQEKNIVDTILEMILPLYNPTVEVNNEHNPVYPKVINPVTDIKTKKSVEKKPVTKRLTAKEKEEKEKALIQSLRTKAHQRMIDSL